MKLKNKKAMSENKFDKIKWYILEAVVLIAAFAGIFLYWQSEERKRIENLKENIKISQDSVATLVLENGKIVYEKQCMELREKELEEFLEISNAEIKELKKKLGSSIATIAELKAIIAKDTVQTVIIHDSTTVFVKDSLIYLKFKNDDKWLSFVGDLKAVGDNEPEVTLYDVNIPVPVTVGQTEEGSFFVLSDNPYLHITDIQAATVKKKENKWGFGLYGGFGVYYGLFNKDLDVGPGFGVAIYRKF